MSARVKISALIAVSLALAWFGYRWLDGDSPPEDAVTDEEHALRGPQRMVFRDGTFVPLDLRELSAVLEDAFTRVPGLVRVSGSVRDSESGEPIPGAEVVFANEMGETSALAESDGRYEIVMQPGFYRAFARADGYVAVGSMLFERLPENHPDPGAVGLPRDELAPLLAVFRDQSNVDMHLHGGARIVGTVYDTAGRPVSGAIITGRLAGFRGLQTRLILGTDMDESDLQGAFELDVPAGSIELSASHRDFAGLSDESSSFLFVSPGDVTRIDLTLTAGCILEGRVVDQRGELMGDGSLEGDSGQPPPNDFVPIGRITAGRFRFARTGSETLRMRAWPWKSPPSEPQTFQCSDGARFEDIVFVIPDADPDLEGTVVTPDGTPIAGAYIDIRPFDYRGMAQQERADAYGEWAFFSLPPGRYHLMAHVAEHGVVARSVTAPARGITLTLGGTGSISGTTRGLDNGVFELIINRCESRSLDGDSTVMFDDLTMPQSTRLVPVENGAFHIDDLPACTLHAVARTPTRSQYIQVEIQSGDIANLALDLSPARLETIHGTVLGPDGAPAEDVAVTRIPGPGAPIDHYAYTTTDESGGYRIQVYTGDQLYFSGASGWAQAEVPEGEDASKRVDVTLDR